MDQAVAGHPAACSWCGSRFDQRARRLRGRILCGRCGTATTDPLPTAAELERAYGDWYRPAAGRRFAGIGDDLLARTRGALARRVDAAAPPGPILDVGAGSGWLVDSLRGRGREALGLERSGHRRDMSETTIAELEGEWAAVVFWHSLEHLPAAGAAIEAATRLLAPDGLLVVAVPDNGSLQARAFGERWLHLDLPRHLTHLTRASLLARLGGLGLRVERVSGLRGGQVAIGWLHGLVGLLPGRPDLYAALRSEAARADSVGPVRRALAIAAGIALLPVALACSAAEVILRRSGTVYVEARAPARGRPSSSTT